MDVRKNDRFKFKIDHAYNIGNALFSEMYLNLPCTRVVFNIIVDIVIHKYNQNIIDDFYFFFKYILIIFKSDTHFGPFPRRLWRRGRVADHARMSWRRSKRVPTWRLCSFQKKFLAGESVIGRSETSPLKRACTTFTNPTESSL